MEAEVAVGAIISRIILLPWIRMKNSAVIALELGEVRSALLVMLNCNPHVSAFTLAKNVKRGN